jgi:hypothetical protein
MPDGKAPELDSFSIDGFHSSHLVSRLFSNAVRVPIAKHALPRAHLRPRVEDCLRPFGLSGSAQLEHDP